jgi:hypothetical protein
MNLLQFYLKRFKDLGSLAEQRFGKHIKNRDPLLPIICVNDNEIERVEQQLNANNYYGYNGLLCFSTVILNPYS